MKFKVFAILFIVVGILLNGCTMPWTMTKFRRTPENLQVYRDCLRTALAASKQDQTAIMQNCLKTLESTNEKIQVTGKPQEPAGCEEIWEIGWHTFYFCK